MAMGPFLAREAEHLIHVAYLFGAVLYVIIIYENQNTHQSPFCDSRQYLSVKWNLWEHFCVSFTTYWQRCDPPAVYQTASNNLLLFYQTESNRDATTGIVRICSKVNNLDLNNAISDFNAPTIALEPHSTGMDINFLLRWESKTLWSIFAIYHCYYPAVMPMLLIVLRATPRLGIAGLLRVR
jgi:hypothetical protein